MAKFRSWNVKRKRFYYFLNGHYFKDEKCTDDWNMIQVWFDWKTVEQSSKYFDLNGKEIFEGDKLKFTVWFYDGHDETYQGLVKLEDGCVWVEIDENNRYFLAEVVANDDNCKIIGNIHEGTQQ